MTQTNLHLIDAFPTASAWQEEWTIWFFLSPFLLLFTGHPIAYQETSLYCQSLVDDQHLCLLPEVYLKKKIRTECATWSHTGTHESKPSCSWNFPWILYGRNHFFSFNLQSFFPTETWSEVSQKWNTKVFPEQGKDLRYLQLPPMVESICNYKESIVTIDPHHICHHSLTFSGLFKEQ